MTEPFDADLLSAESVLAIVSECEALPPQVREWIVNEILSPSQRRKSRLERRDGAIRRVALTWHSGVASTKARADALAADLNRPSRTTGEHRRDIETLLRDMEPDVLSSRTIRQILAG